MQSNFSNSDTCEAELPEHWEMRIDTRTGLPYYLNHFDQYTTWDDPRLVSAPRGMLNHMGSMLRPEPTQRRRQASVEPSSSSNRYFSPMKQDECYTQSLPRRAWSPQPQPTSRRPFMDDWFGNGFKQFDTEGEFFEPSWPFKSHTIQRQHPSRAQSMQPTSAQVPFNPAREAHQEGRGFPLPVRPERRQPHDETDNRYEGEHYIIPTQYKRKNQTAKSSATDKNGAGTGEARVNLPNNNNTEVEHYNNQPKVLCHCVIVPYSMAQNEVLVTSNFTTNVRNV